MVAVGVVCPRRLFRKALCSLLLALPIDEGVTIPFDVDTLPDALEQIIKSKPQILLMDCEGVAGCFSYVQKVREISPLTRCLLLTEHAEEESEALAASVGAWGLITERADQDLVRQAIQKVLRGEMWFSPATMSRAVQHFLQRRLPDDSARDRLTVREAEITALLAKGLQNKEIAQRLFLSENTIRRYTETIYRKLRVNSRLEAALWYHEHIERS